MKEIELEEIKKEIKAEVDEMIDKRLEEFGVIQKNKKEKKRVLSPYEIMLNNIFWIDRCGCVRVKKLDTGDLSHVLVNLVRCEELGSFTVCVEQTVCIEQLVPIKITERLLMDNGFEKNDMSFLRKMENDSIVRIAKKEDDNTKFEVSVMKDDYLIYYCEAEFLHELQNAFCKNKFVISWNV